MFCVDTKSSHFSSQNCCLEPTANRVAAPVLQIHNLKFETIFKTTRKKKVLLRSRRRHTAHRVASTHYAVPVGVPPPGPRKGGYPILPMQILTWNGIPPVLVVRWGYPHPNLRWSRSTPSWTWDGGTPILTWNGGTSIEVWTNKLKTVPSLIPWMWAVTRKSSCVSTRGLLPAVKQHPLSCLWKWGVPSVLPGVSLFGDYFLISGPRFFPWRRGGLPLVLR